MKPINYHKKKFKLISNSESGALTSSFIFEYKQEGNILRSTYKGNGIQLGQLLGIVSETGKINMLYQQIDNAGIMRSGRCTSTPEILKNGKIRLHEFWHWTSGALTKGNSVLEEL